MNKLILATTALVAMIASPADANDWGNVVGKVTRIEATYAPAQLPFQIDMPAGNCPAGVWLRWNAMGPDAATQAHNYEAMLAVILTAKTTGQQIVVWGDNANCTVNFVHLI